MATRPPLPRQLADRIIARIRSGDLKPGDELPSTAKLAEQEGVSPATVYRAVRLLRELDVVDTQPGRGVYVAERPGGTA